MTTYRVRIQTRDVAAVADATGRDDGVLDKNDVLEYRTADTGEAGRICLLVSRLFPDTVYAMYVMTEYK